MAKTVRSHRSPSEIRQIVRQLPAILSGRSQDVMDLRLHFHSLFARSLYQSIHKAYVVKMKGGTDELGINWKDLKPSTKAYGRKSLRRNLPLPGPKSRPTLTPRS